jgi:hypothetical protein
VSKPFSSEVVTSSLLTLSAICRQQCVPSVLLVYDRVSSGLLRHLERFSLEHQFQNTQNVEFGSQGEVHPPLSSCGKLGCSDMEKGLLCTPEQRLLAGWCQRWCQQECVCSCFVSFGESSALVTFWCQDILNQTRESATENPCRNVSNSSVETETSPWFLLSGSACTQGHSCM